MATLDFIEEACDILDKDERPYILILGEPGASAHRITSNLGDNYQLALDQAEVMKINIIEHIHRFYINKG